jgi:hypothetical protein
MATFMIILLIIGILIIGYISTGYAPNRVLKTEVGHIYYWGIGKRILGSIRIQNKKSGKKVPWWLSNIPFPIGFQRIFVPLKWPAGCQKRFLAQMRINLKILDH